MASPRERAKALDSADTLKAIRHEFVIPTKAEIASHQLAKTDSRDADSKEAACTYLCGNSLGLQPKRTATRLQQYLTTWGTQGVQAHHRPLDGSPLPTWLDADDRAAEMMAPIVGAQQSEVAVMQTLTANLHLLMSSFYKPDIKGKHKIILESKAFPSDHFVVESQLRHHGLPPSSMVLISSPYATSPVLSTYDILSTISEHAATTALLLLPGIQYYTGQLLDIPTITAFAHKHDILVVWDLAHAAGNVPLRLHDWDVDAAAWCSYKYLNGGPGCIGGMFVHERHSSSAARQQQAATTTGAPGGDDEQREGSEGYRGRDRLAGWWGNDKATRFVMETRFRPVEGAAGFQLSNPSILDITSLCASLEVFGEAGGVAPLRRKSLGLTGFLEELLKGMPEDQRRMFRAITPRDPDQRGAQLSLLLLGESDGDAAGQDVLDVVMGELEARSVVVDERKPNVVRVAPAPLYNTFEDCVDFVEAFGAALEAVKKTLSAK